MKRELNSLLVPTLLISVPVSFNYAAEYECVVAGDAYRGERLTSAGDYWTPERMKNAVPMDLVIGGEDEPLHVRSAQETQIDWEASGPMVIQKGEKPSLGGPMEPMFLGPPQLQSDRDTLYPIADDRESIDTEMRSDEDRPYPFTGYEVPYNYQEHPFSTMGKLFFSRGGTDWVCSAATLVSEHKRLVWTAGHCVAEGDGVSWSEDVLFIPAYRDGSAPYEKWEACNLYTTEAWFNDGDLSLDLGGIETCDRPEDGARIQDVVGSMGFVANISPVQHWNAFGYPAGAPFDGESLNTCQAGFGVEDAYKSPATLGIGCDMNGGSSGGPWVVDLSPHHLEGNYLNGLNSYGKDAIPNTMYSPYFGNAFLDLYECAVNRGA